MSDVQKRMIPRSDSYRNSSVVGLPYLYFARLDRVYAAISNGTSRHPLCYSLARWSRSNQPDRTLPAMPLSRPSGSAFQCSIKLERIDSYETPAPV